MLAHQLIKNTYPAIHLHDKVAFALSLMDDYDVQHLPVINDEKFVGLVSKTDLLDTDETYTINTLHDHLLKVSVHDNEHFLKILKHIDDNNLSLLVVVNDQLEIVGCVSSSEMLSALNNYVGNNEQGAVIVVETDKRNFSFGEISRLVETNDAYITQVNTQTETETGMVLVTIKINKKEVSDIVATFQRYDYTVKYYFGEEEYANELKDNYNHLIAYLNI